MKTYTYRIHLEPEPEGGFTVTVPTLPGCVTWGATHEEATALKRAGFEELRQRGSHLYYGIPKAIE